MTPHVERLESRISELEQKIDDLVADFIDLKCELSNYSGDNEFVVETLNKLENILKENKK